MAGMVVNVLVGVGAAAIVAGVIISHFRKKRKGQSSCACGCNSCPSQDGCRHCEGE